jgi:fatty acid desaturase
VAVQPKVIRPPVPGPERRGRTAVDNPPRRSGAAGQAPQAPQRPLAPLDPEATAPSATSGRRSSAPGAMAMLVVLAAGALVMVAAVAVVAEVNRWWVLVPAVLLVLVGTLGVLATIVHMLADDG